MFAGVTSVWSRLGEAGALRNTGTPQGQEWGIYMFPWFQARKDTDFIVPLLEQVSEFCMFFILQWLLACLVCGFGGDCILHAVLVIQQLLQVGERAYWACPHPKFLCCCAGSSTHWSRMSTLTLPFQAVTVLAGYVFPSPCLFHFPLLSYFHFQTPLNSIPSSCEFIQNWSIPSQSEKGSSMTQEEKQETNKTSKAQEAPETYKSQKVLPPRLTRQSLEGDL